VDISAISAAYSSLKIAKELLNATVGVRDFNITSSRVAAINDQLLKTQDGLFEASERMAKLQQDLFDANAELAELKKKADDHERYALVTIGQRGVMVYRLKDRKQGEQVVVEGDVEPPHYLCQACLDVRGHRVVLQPYGTGFLICNGCKASFCVSESNANSYRAITEDDRY
jgi:hypothetical protein